MSVKTKIAIIISATLVVVILSLTGLFIYSVNNFVKSDVIASNVTFDGVYIGDITKEEAVDILKEKSVSLNNSVKVVYNDKAFEFAPGASGLTYDFEAVADAGYNFGRKGNFFSSAWDVICSRFTYNELNPVYSYNSEVFENTVTTIAKANGIEFKNIDVKIYENYASVKINSELKRIDINKLYSDTITAVESKDKKEIPLPVEIMSNVSSQMVYDMIYVKPVNAVSDFKNGVTVLTPHTIGVLVNIDDIEKKLLEGKREFTVPVTKKYPDVRTEHFNSRFFGDVLGSNSSKYNASLAGRTRNVTLSADRINGVILNPGDVFSYNNIVGPRTAAAGFSVATIYTNSGLSEELGGGICQTSSTLYNAALYADLKIEERQNHMYTVSYAKNGLDATVAYGFIDFKFRNNLNSPIKIVTSANNGVLTVTILGKKTNNNKVELYTDTLASYPFSETVKQNPSLSPGTKKVVQNGSYGYKVTATKVVKDSSGNIIKKESLGTSVYKPLAKIVEAGPPQENAVSEETPQEVISPDNTSDAVLPGNEENKAGQSAEQNSVSGENISNKEDTQSSELQANGDKENLSDLTDNSAEQIKPTTEIGAD